MTRSARTWGRTALTAAGLVALSGCDVGEAFADGVFGGVSDTIAAVISTTLLTLLQVG